MLCFPKLNNRNRGKRLTATSVLLLALASAAPVRHAQEWDQLNGRDKAASTNPPSAPLFQFDKVQFTGRLNETGDRMEITAAVITNFDPKGELIGGPNQFSTKVHGVRIPLEVLPFTARSLPIPSASPVP